MSSDRSDTPPVESPLAQLERGFVLEFVRGRGQDPLRLDELANRPVRRCSRKPQSTHRRSSARWNPDRISCTTCMRSGRATRRQASTSSAASWYL